MAQALTHRALLVPLLAAAHLAVVAVMLLQPAIVPDRPAAAAMMVTAIPASGESVESAPPPMVGEIAAVVERPEFEVADAVAVASGPCTLAASVEAALRSDRSVDEAVARIPAAARSVSNSLQLWDGAWAKAAGIGGDAALSPIRAAVMAQVRAAPAECRDEPVIGPRLVVVPDGNRQIVLAFGSGRWTWAQTL